MVVMAVRHQHDIDLWKRVEGEARIDHTGSTRMLRSRVWISQVTWPTNDSRTLSPPTRAGGVSLWAFGTQSGQLARLRSVPNCQRSTSPNDFGGTPSGSKKRVPSK